MPNEADKEKIIKKLTNINTELRKWPEDRIKLLLKKKLVSEGWEITKISMGKQQGVDLEASKGSRTIIIEAKGEPQSLASYQQERRHNIEGALLSIVTQMTSADNNRRYCMAFPNNGYYLRSAKKLIPILVREKLGLHLLFLEEDSSIKVLMPNAGDTSNLNHFDELFA